MVHAAMTGTRRRCSSLARRKPLQIRPLAARRGNCRKLARTELARFVYCGNTLACITHTAERVGGRTQHPRSVIGRRLFMGLFVHSARDLR